MQKKRDFENKFKTAVQSNPELNIKYGDIWNKIADTRAQLRKYSNELFALAVNSLNTSELFFVANDVVDLAYELKLPEDQEMSNTPGNSLIQQLRISIHLILIWNLRRIS